MRYVILIFTGLVLFGCVNLKNYYYPYSSCLPYKVYKYECFSAPSQTQYWIMTYNPETNSFITEAFNFKLERIEYFEETIGDKGTELVEFSAVNDGRKEKSFPPVKKDVYKWNDKSPYKYAVKFYNGPELVLFEKERVYIGKESKKIQSGEYDCVKFKEFYTMTFDGSDEQFKYSQVAYYAKGLGMIKYERVFSNGEQVDRELTRVLNETEWKFKVANTNIK